MEFRNATLNELQAIYELYNDVIDHQQYDTYGADWTKDVYPSRKDIEDHLKDDIVYVVIEEDRYAGAGIITLHEDPIYKNAIWSSKHLDEEVAVLHLM